MMPIFMLINDIFCVCMLLTYHLCFITTMFMRERERDQVKPWSLVQFLIIRSSLVTFTLFYFQLFRPENHQKPCSFFVSFGFVNLREVGAWQPPQIVEDAKLFVHYCRFFGSEEKEPTSGFPECSIITLSYPCGENLSCCITLRLKSQRVTF
jgi:hypothetical protein